jgi:N-acetylmuramoyl-L-alanine amidase
MYIELVDPRETYHTIVVVDAGHGGHQPGASSYHRRTDRNAPSEAQINLAIVQNLLEIFDEPGILLIPTRTENQFLSTAERTAIANDIGDYFISVHCNADRYSNRPNGTLTLYGIADGSEELARVFQDALISALGSRDRGIHYSPQFHILRESEIPVILLELLFLSNADDATRLAQPQTQMLIAQTIADTIVNLSNK